LLSTVKTRIICLCARTLELPLLVRCEFFSFLSVSGERFSVFFASFPEEEISDYIAHGAIIRVFTVVGWLLMKVTIACGSLASTVQNRKLIKTRQKRKAGVCS